MLLGIVTGLVTNFIIKFGEEYHSVGPAQTIAFVIMFIYLSTMWLMVHGSAMKRGIMNFVLYYICSCICVISEMYVNS